MNPFYILDNNKGARIIVIGCDYIRTSEWIHLIHQFLLLWNCRKYFLFVCVSTCHLLVKSERMRKGWTPVSGCIVGKALAAVAFYFTTTAQLSSCFDLHRSWQPSKLFFIFFTFGIKYSFRATGNSTESTAIIHMQYFFLWNALIALIYRLPTDVSAKYKNESCCPKLSSTGKHNFKLGKFTLRSRTERRPVALVLNI